MLVCPGFVATDLRKNALGVDDAVGHQTPLAMRKVATAQEVAESIYHGGVKRKELLVLSNVDWRARVFARYFPRLFEWVLMSRTARLKPRRR
jgi:short-subunit dehydrogenase